MSDRNKSHFFGAAAVIMIAVLAGVFSWLAGFQLWLDDKRMESHRIPASGQIVFLAIDKQTLDQIGEWPWKRDVHAKIIDMLVKAGAHDIAFDIDFSLPSNADQDEELARSLERAGGSVILPAFAQANTSGVTLETAYNTPLEMFGKNSWQAVVNYLPHRDGFVRDALFGLQIDGADVYSLPSLIAGELGPIGKGFRINFSIDPQTIPTYSVIDLLQGRLSQTDLKGKQVLVGADALELRDNLTVPVHGVIAGPRLHIMAAETLLQKKTPVVITPWLQLAVSALAILLIALSGRPGKLVHRLALIVGLGALLEVIAHQVFIAHNVMLVTAESHLLLLLFAVTHTLQVTDLRTALLRLARIENKNLNALFSQVFTDSSDAILVINEKGEIIHASIEARHLFELGDADLEHRGTGSVLMQAITEEGRKAIDALKIDKWQPGDRKYRFFQSDDLVLQYSITPSRLTRATGKSRNQVHEEFIVTLICQDVTVRRQQERRIEYLSNHDEMTGALRRHAFLQNVKALPAEDLAIFAVNLHRFKNVNRLMGREAGDALLKAVYERLQQLFAGDAVISRLGGDNFALALTGEINTTAIAKRIEKSLSAPFNVSRNAIRVGVHVGLATSNLNLKKDADAILRDAETALDEARHNSGNAIVRYDAQTDAKLNRASVIERELWSAIEKQQLRLVYQPQVDLNSGQIVGVEALMRWEHPELGSVSPGEFVEIAEANGFIGQLGKWAIEQACIEATAWPQKIGVAVNVAAQQFQHGDMLNVVLDALKRSGLSPEQLQLELTESVFLEESDELSMVLSGFHQLGITIALDDFGTGYASIGYLSKYPFDKIKIDQSFVRQLIADTASQAIIKSTVVLANGLNLELICEGVETREQAQKLTELGCAQAQGYFFGKPLASDEIATLLDTAKPGENRLIA